MRICGAVDIHFWYVKTRPQLRINYNVLPRRNHAKIIVTIDLNGKSWNALNPFKLDMKRQFWSKATLTIYVLIMWTALLCAVHSIICMKNAPQMPGFNTNVNSALEEEERRRERRRKNKKEEERKREKKREGEQGQF